MQQSIKDRIYEPQKALDDRIRWLQNDSRISKANKEFILNFLKDKQSEGIGTVRAGIIVQHLRRIAILADKPFKPLCKQSPDSSVGI